MRSMSSLIHRLKTDFPALVFLETEHFSWSPRTQTVSYTTHQSDARQQVLHEVAHGILDHRAFHHDVELLAMETEAWNRAESLAKQYDVDLDQAMVQDYLDTYRDWLHTRSTCPACTATGYQTAASTYECAACGHRWRVNDARICGLKRYSLSTTKNTP